MSKKIVLNVEKRNIKGKKNHLNEVIPAVVYGSGMKNEAVSVNKLDFTRLYKQVGKSGVFELKIGDSKNINVLVHDLQYYPVSGEVMHIDFLQVNMKEVVEAEVPLVFVGESSAVKEKGGTLVKVVNKVFVEALPNDLPSEIEVNLSKIVDFEDHITVEDLDVSKKVKLMVEEGTIIASVTQPRTESELESLNEKVDGDVSKVESDKKEKKEDSKE